MEGSRPLKKAAQYTTLGGPSGPPHTLKSVVSLRFTATPLMCTY